MQPDSISNLPLWQAGLVLAPTVCAGAAALLARPGSNADAAWRCTGCLLSTATGPHLYLAGRSFLHDYDHRLDPELGVLTLIMTAPMVVTNWINLQYHASTLDNRRYGSGNKVLHDGGQRLAAPVSHRPGQRGGGAMSAGRLGGGVLIADSRRKHPQAGA